MNALLLTIPVYATWRYAIPVILELDIEDEEDEEVGEDDTVEAARGEKGEGTS